MVIKKNKLWICDVCNFAYKEKKWAQKCEDFCNKNRQCSLEITKHAIQLKNKNE